MRTVEEIVNYALDRGLIEGDEINAWERIREQELNCKFCSDSVIKGKVLVSYANDGEQKEWFADCPDCEERGGE